MSAASTSATSSDLPAYLVLHVTTTTPVNMLEFDWSFGAAGTGLLQVFVDGYLVREIDQRHVMQASTETEQIYIGGTEGMLTPGQHDITFRLDGFGVNPSNIVLTSIKIGMKQLVSGDGIYVFPYAGRGGIVTPATPQLVTSGQTKSVTVIANEGFTHNLTVRGSCPQGEWIGHTWTTGAIDSNCSVSFSFDLLDTDNDAIPDLEDVDDDNDNISDIDESSIYGTDPLLVDTDGDSYSDFEEILVGSNPLDNISTPLNIASGDINQDSQVDIKDLLLALRILNGQYIPTQQEQNRWDVAPLVNGTPAPDQNNDLGDYLVLQRKVLGAINF